MPPFPDFADTALFPNFTHLPEPLDSDPQEAKDWFLLARVKDNMTINKPTLVCEDRDKAPFAMVFEGLGRDDLDLKKLGFKKGATAVIPRAYRTVPEQEGKRAFVRIAEGRAAEVKAIGAPLERVLELGLSLRGYEAGKEEEVCETCGAKEKSLMKCAGCGRVRYCSKACQVKGWNEDDHKLDCKALKALFDIWPSGAV